MRETFIDYLRELYNPELNATRLVRPNGSIAAELADGRWLSHPTQEEIIGYTIYAGRGLPSILCSNNSDPSNGILVGKMFKPK